MIEAKELYENLELALNMAQAYELPWIGEPGQLTWEEVETLSEMLPSVTADELMSRLKERDDETWMWLEQAETSLKEYDKLIETDAEAAAEAMEEFLQNMVTAISEAAIFDLNPSLHYQD